LKVLFVHNRYQIPGGEDSVVEAEIALLREAGHEVLLYSADNDKISGFLSKVSAAFSATYSHSAKRDLARVLKRESPDVVHVHNFFPTLSPSIYDACAEAGVAVVQTLHNYRTICAGGLLMRDEEICELCVKGSPFTAVKYGCYRGSKAGTLAVARMVATHRKRGTWSHKVQRVIALTEFARSKFTEAGFNEERIAIKPNFIADPITDDELGSPRNGALFVGRISVEKGVEVMLRAWRQIAEPLSIAGDGPLFERLSEEGKGAPYRFVGRQNKAEVFSAMKSARFMVVPSLWYEGFPMVIVEAFAHGLPVVCSRLGGMAEVVEDGISGLHFEAGNAVDLADKVQQLLDDPKRCEAMGRAARKQFLEHYGPQKNLAHLERIYAEARGVLELP
jgi:glycosyltransferase involved in cell wall biosynthesis